MGLSCSCLSFAQEYDMNAISKELELPGAFVIGAGAVASKVVGVNAEVNHIYSITDPE